MKNAKTVSFHFNSNNDDYFYTGYIIKPVKTEVTVIHVALVHQRTKRMRGVQSAIASGRYGMIFGTMKTQINDINITMEFWELFRVLLKRHTQVVTLIAEPPTALAKHYVKTYPGVRFSEDLPCSTLPGLSVIEITIERE